MSIESGDYFDVLTTSGCGVQ